MIILFNTTVSLLQNLSITMLTIEYLLLVFLKIIYDICLTNEYVI